MLRSISSNNDKFKRVDFRPGYNIILAERKSVEKDNKKSSRNGSGKTTLVEIIHFCLGASVTKKSLFKNSNLKGWSFILELDIQNECFTLERFTDNPNKIYVAGPVDKLSIEMKYDRSYGKYYVSPKVFNKYMTDSMYGIEDTSISYLPSFRELISYSVRRGTDGFSSPFEFFSKQKAYSIQACNAYFLNLSVEYASKFQEIKDKKNGIKNLKTASKLGVITNTNFNIGELNTELISQQLIVDNMREELDAFQVHPQYNDIAKEANDLTEKIHGLTNNLALKKRLLTRYEEGIVQENTEIPLQEIKDLYEEAGILFKEDISKPLSEILEFHKSLIRNRREYLNSEIEELNYSIKQITAEIKELSDNRAEILKVLETHGALEEYSELQDRYSKEYQKLESIKTQLDQAEYIQNSSSLLKIEGEELLIESRKDYVERKKTRENAIALFKENTEFLYPEAGVLTIDLKETGYDFGVDIRSSRSQGVNYMKIFCYDMVLAELGQNKDCFPDFWVHDSTIFDGVDERQTARALMLAEMKCKETGLQYISLLNSDAVPYNEFDDEFTDEFNDSVILNISDQEDEGLLGIRF